MKVFSQAPQKKDEVIFIKQDVPESNVSDSQGKTKLGESLMKMPALAAGKKRTSRRRPRPESVMISEPTVVDYATESISQVQDHSAAESCQTDLELISQFNANGEPFYNYFDEQKPSKTKLTLSLSDAKLAYNDS